MADPFANRLLSLVMFAFFLPIAGCSHQPSRDVLVQGPGRQPELGFACCEQGLDEAQHVFADPGVMAQLERLHATVAMPTADLSSQRASLVRALNRQGIPVIAWIVLPRDQGYYLNAGNVPEAAERLTEVEQWTRANQLRWSAVGLDIEPNFADLEKLRRRPLRLAATLLAHAADLRRITRSREDYARLVAEIHGWGYPVQIYEMPYVASERFAHSAFADRMLGTVDVRGDQNYLMLYTTFARPLGAAMIWLLGPESWGITVGSTDGPGTPGAGAGPQDWTEFARDLIVASHFTPHIGVYDLEGCVRQGFLQRLLAMNWSQSAVISAAELERARRIRFLSHTVLWIGSDLIWLVAAAAALGFALMRARRRRRASPL
ncbi:MAG: hypothetical protein WA294_06605 [Acidobacteriaceae bacterium]